MYECIHERMYIPGVQLLQQVGGLQLPGPRFRRKRGPHDCATAGCATSEFVQGAAEGSPSGQLDVSV